MPDVSPDFPETPRPATYRDMPDAPSRKIAQIVDGTLHTCAQTGLLSRESVLQNRKKDSECLAKMA